MTRTATLVCGLLLAVPAMAAAQNREQQQLLSELRVLQEQAQQLLLRVNTLADAVKDLTKTTTARLDDQANATRKGFADQKVTIDTIAENGRALRENTNDTNVRISSLGHEIGSIAQNLAALQTIVAPLAALIPTPPAGDTPPAPQTTTPPAGIATERMYQTAYGDYMAGQWDIAIGGFQGYLKTCPTCPNVAEAQFLIGEALFATGKYKEAVAAYGLVITNYPKSSRDPDTYYKRGVAYENLGQKDRAKQDFQYVIQNFPESNFKGMAQAGLLRVSKLTGA
jgi:tol-pal system protein YbgF